MEKQSSLAGAAHQAASRLRERKVLFLCHDLWRSPASDSGYLPFFKRVLAYAPRSKLLVSTRDQEIAEKVSMNNCAMFGALPPHGPSARKLLCQVIFGNMHID